MPLKAIYNSNASQYDTADCFGSITESHDCAIKQINQANIDPAPHYNILDMGVGDGSFCEKSNLIFLRPT